MSSASVHPSGPAPGAFANQRWRRLVPLAFITYSFAYLDRSNYSIGVAGGLKDDNSAGAVGGFVGAYVVGWLQGGIGNGAAYAFMAVALFLAAGLMFAVDTRGRKGVDLPASPSGSERQVAS